MLDRWCLALGCMVLACGGRTATDLPGAGAAGTSGTGGTANSGGAYPGTGGVVAVGGSAGAAAYPSTGGYNPGGAGGAYPGGGPSYGGYPGYGGYFPGGYGGGVAGTGGKSGSGCYYDGIYYPIGAQVAPCCYCTSFNGIGCYEPCSGAGGSSGTGGGPSMCPPAPVFFPGTFDDFEDGDYSVYHPLGYGEWYPYSDETGFQSWGLVSPGLNGSVFALNVNGYGNVDWGAGTGIALHGIAPTCPVDWSQAYGIGFTASANRVAVRVNLVTTATQAAADGGRCFERCYDHFGTTIVVGPGESFLLSFYSMSQEGWGTPAALDLSQVLGVQFQMRAGSAYNLTVDDLYLYTLFDEQR